MKLFRYSMLAAFFLAAYVQVHAQFTDVRWMRPGAREYGEGYFSPDGSVIACDYQQGVMFVDAATGDILSVLDREISSMAYSPDGMAIACGSSGGKVLLVDAVTYEIVDSLQHTYSSRVVNIFFTPDGRGLITKGHSGQLASWDLITRRVRHTFTTSSGGFTFADIAPSPDGELLAARWGDMVAIFSINDGVLRDSLIFTGAFNVRFSHDGERLLVATLNIDDVDLIIWDHVNGDKERQLALPVYGPLRGSPFTPRITLTPDGGWVAVSTGSDSSVLFVNLATGALEQGLYFDVPIHSTVFSSDGRYLLVAGKGLYFHQLDATTWSYIRHLPVSQTGHLFQSPDGALVATSSYGSDDGVWVWDVATGRLVRRLQRDASLLPRPLFTGDGKGMILLKSCGDSATTAEIRDVQTGQLTRDYPCDRTIVWGSPLGFDAGGEHLVTRLPGERWGRLDLRTGWYTDIHQTNQSSNLWALSSDGRYLVTWLDWGRLIVRRIATGETVRAISTNGLSLTTLACSPDGSYIVAATSDFRIHIWNVNTVEHHDYAAHGAKVNEIAVSQDGRWIVSASNDGTLKVWRFSTRQLAHAYTSPLMHMKTGWMDIALAPDFSTITAMGQHGMLVNWSTEPVLRTLGVQAGNVPVVAAGLSASPNPATIDALISFDLPAASRGSVKVFDLLGVERAVLAEGILPAGRQSYRWDAADMPPGLYLVRLEAGATNESMRLLKTDGAMNR